MSKEPFSAEQRRRLLEEYNRILEDIDDPDQERERSHHYESLRGVWTRYRDGLHRIPVTRCPFDKEIVMHSFDPHGLDGLWWDSYEPVRPVGGDQFCPHWLTQCGAVKLAEPHENSPVLVSPGPGVPYVIPAILKRKDTVATISSLSVNEHVVYWIFYFSKQPNFNVPLAAVWPTQYRPPGPGHVTAAEQDEYDDYDYPEDWDFNLKPWLIGRKLLWIHPKDPDMSLQKGATECPYLDLPGSRKPVTLQYGQVVEHAGGVC